eukprot:2772539-Rhodomonas_salina.3
MRLHGKAERHRLLIADQIGIPTKVPCFASENSKIPGFPCRALGIVVGTYANGWQLFGHRVVPKY